MRLSVKSTCRVSSLILTALLLYFSAQAQTHYTSRVSIGGKAGTETSYVFFNPSVKQTLPFGATAGVMFKYTEEKNFALIAELNFAQKGWRENLSPSQLKYRRTLNYLELPVLTQICFGTKNKFFFNVGPQVSLFLTEKTSSNFNFADKNLPEDFPNKNRVHDELTLPIEKKVDFGINAGLGGEFGITPYHSIQIEGRFYYGIGNIFNAGHRDPFRASNSMGISLTAGYWFRIK